MKRIDACAWCSKFVSVPDDYNPITQDVVCSQACAVQERAFRFNFSDEAIGEANQQQFGVNPNLRGKNGKKGKESA